MPVRHTKSRLGCRVCKRRKIKCDEGRPQCANCLRFGVDCDFAAKSESVPRKAEGNHEGKQQKRGRPRADWTLRTREIQEAAVSNGYLNQPDLLDFELYHHYLTSAALTLVEPGGGAGLWCEGVPRLAFKQSAVLSLILAFSAYHLAACSNRPGFRLVGQQHYARALHAATELFSSTKNRKHHQDNPVSPALYIVAVFVAFVSLAQGPRPGNWFLAASDGDTPWLPLIRGVRAIVTTSGWPDIFSGPLAPYTPDSSLSDKKNADKTNSVSSPGDSATPSGTEDWRISLHNAADIVDLLAEPDCVKTQYKRDVRLLEECFEMTFGQGRQAHRNCTGKMQIVMMWVYSLDDVLIQGLQKKNPIALILLGHFSVLLHTLRGYWFIQGWGRHVLDEVCRADPAVNKWLSWPSSFMDYCNATGESIDGVS